MRVILLCAAFFCAGLAVPVEAQSTLSRQIPVDEAFRTWKVQNISGFPGGFEARYTIIVAEGVIEVCGAIAYTNAQLRRIFRESMRRASVTMNGQEILRDLTFFSRAKRPRDLGSTAANCRSTGVKRPAGEARFQISTSIRGKV